MIEVIAIKTSLGFLSTITKEGQVHDKIETALPSNEFHFNLLQNLFTKHVSSIQYLIENEMARNGSRVLPLKLQQHFQN